MQAALAQFQADLALVRRSVDWLTATLPVDAISLQIGAATYSGLTVLLCGYFESFLKASMKAFVAGINGSAKSFVDLPESLRLQHFRGGSKRVQDGVGTARKSGDATTLHDLSRRLASVAGQPYEIVWEAFTETHANPSGDTVKELISKLGVEDPWKRINDSPPTGHGDLRIFLDTFIEMRNECAHTGTPSSAPTQSDVVSYIDGLGAIAEKLVHVLTVHSAAILT